MAYETGPIRPPSEAASLLVRVSRNCPWNRCAFCPVYKGAKFSRRTVAEVHADLDALAEIHGEAPRTVFLQDADPLITKPDDLVEILRGIRARFPLVRRITTYARSKTLRRRTPKDLRRIREAGLDRIHVGMESGCDRVLALVSKGATREDHIEAGTRAKEAGFSLCYYVMPGLGGRRFTDEHADDTASAIAAVMPHHVRLRTTAPIPGTPLNDLQETGEFAPLSEEGTVREIRRFLAGLEGATLRLESDHMLNLLMDLKGDLPEAHGDLIALCDAFLNLSPEDRDLFILGRRTGRILRVEHLDRPRVRAELEEIKAQIDRQGLTIGEIVEELKRRMV